MFRKNKIPGAFRLETGTILVPLVEEPKVPCNEFTVVYSRVSSTENKSNLENQATRVSQYCNAKGWIVNSVIKECGSGLNDNRPKLLKVLTDPKVTRIVVEHKDRLTRFGFNYIKELYKGEIVVINEVESEEHELMQDFISLVTSFCARIYGRRRSKRKTEKIIAELKKWLR